MIIDFGKLSPSQEKWVKTQLGNLSSSWTVYDNLLDMIESVRPQIHILVSSESSETEVEAVSTKGRAIEQLADRLLSAAVAERWDEELEPGSEAELDAFEQLRENDPEMPTFLIFNERIGIRRGNATSGSN